MTGCPWMVIPMFSVTDAAVAPRTITRNSRPEFTHCTPVLAEIDTRLAVTCSGVALVRMVGVRA